ncbi:hypothetical protein FGKAn22_17200 [Ferrigenium kumadai]|uniref:Glycosyltransferase n=1 Tax=Ferrigenium kumadai TaxID=1682490 RepID=A0AAN1T069_9PROT|nr:hypothetical protein [Ferrigenium kumadai]BBJ00028.1 hypothetical protein FGKAn22_17200 [Ferrigenium kumadai]
MAEKNRALIATHHLVDFAGSEISTLELATTLMSMGWEVTVAAILTGEPMIWEFHSRSIPLFNLLETELPIDNQHFDLVWIHHLPVFHEIVLFRKITGSKLIYCSLSPYEPFEAVPALLDSVTLLLANSRENADHILSERGLPEGSVKIFPNSVPQHFWKVSKANYPSQPKKIALVSNHPPKEITELISILQQAGREVRHIGIKGEPLLVTPGELMNYDAVISIGKTVQYCFALKIPVYCYDHFGGPGWLNKHNFDLAYRNNFSGRGFSKKDSHSIIHELDAGFEKAVEQLEEHHEFAKNHFDLERNLKQMFNYEPFSIPNSGSMYQQLILEHACYKRLAIARQTSADTYKVNILNEEIRRRDAEIQRLTSTYSWQITKPLRLLANLPQLIKAVLMKK